MRGIPKSFKTKQDILNTHKMAMRHQVDINEWLYRLKSFITPNKYTLPVLKNTGDVFYIPYTELPLPDEYTDNKRVYGFDTSVSVNEFNSSKLDIPMSESVDDKLLMLKINAKLDLNIHEIVIYYGYPILTETMLTKEDVLNMIKELS